VISSKKSSTDWASFAFLGGGVAVVEGSEEEGRVELEVERGREDLEGAPPVEDWGE